MKIVVFPGQGSQKVGMCKDLYDNFSLVKELFTEAEDISKLPLSEIIFNGPSYKLQETNISQIAIMLSSVAALRVLEESIDQKIYSFANLVAGHSLGEYTALVASESLKFSDAVVLLKARGEAMAAACSSGGAMLAIIGIEDINIINEIAQKASTNNLICEVANDNAKGQVILSGNREALELAAKLAKDDYKAKLVKFLDVSGPFHSSLMSKAVPILQEALDKITLNPLKVPFISNVTSNKVDSASEVKELLLKQIINPVNWRESMINAVKLGATTLIEVGPNKVLTGLMKRIDNNIKCVNIETVVDIKDFTL
mgnify:CR=1 FL=1